jgi:4-hydroxy-tetrahydrodipicolinate synthase
MKKLERLITAMVTPFDSNGEVDYEQARRLALALLNSGSDGLLVAGTTGEAPTLSKEEKLRLFSEVKSAVGEGAAILANTGNYNTTESLRFTREAERIGVDACLMVVPYYNKPTQEGLFQHFKTIAEGTGLPCVLYNVPSRTVTNLTADTVIKLSRVDNIIGIKEASGDQIAKIINKTGEDFLVWSGNDGDTFPVMALGGYGLISVASHLVGKLLKEMMNYILSGKTSEASKIHHQLVPLINAMFIVSNPIPIKYALNQVGFNVGKPRLPLIELDEKSGITLREILKNYIVDLPI